jgi:prepilin-type N-terminal cleavage/methylation domain-containing protein
MKRPYTNDRGFTIVELLVVIVVIGILAAITIVSYANIQSRANDSAIKSDLKNMATSLEVWKVDNGGYPDPGNPTNNLQTVNGLTASKNSYAVSPVTVSNLVYCYDNSDIANRTRTYAIIALSKSGNAFYVSATQPGVVQSFTNEWGGAAGGDMAMCVSLGDNISNAYRGYAATDTPVWRLWAD